MSLTAFHYVFITLSALLGAGLCYWGFGDPALRWLGVVGILMFALLIPYMRWFRRKMASLGQGS